MVTLLNVNVNLVLITFTVAEVDVSFHSVFIEHIFNYLNNNRHKNTLTKIILINNRLNNQWIRVNNNNINRVEIRKQLFSII